MERPGLVRLAFAVLRDREAAEDVVQDVFVSLHQAERRGVARPEAWLRRACVNRSLNVLRERLRRRDRERVTSLRPVDGPSAEMVAEGRETAREIRGALGRMPVRQAAALILRSEGLSYREVSEATGIRPTQVGTVLARATARLRKEIEMHHAPR